jgi:branched-chain amino acid transport system substrate-binding protein
MLEEQINAKGGINGHKLEIVAYDTESDETKAVTSVKKLIEQDKVAAIIGPSTTGETMALIPTIENAKIPMVSCAASVSIVQPVKPYVFKTPETDALAAATIIDSLKAKNITKIALITTSSAYGTNGKDAWAKAAGPAGITIVTQETFADKDLDMTGQLTRIKGTDAQAVVCWGTNPGPAIIAKNMKQLQMTIPLYQSHGVANAKFIELAGDAANGVMLPAGKMLVYQSLPDSDPQKAVLASYAKSYKDKYGKEADPFGGYAYDAVMLVTKAMEKAGTDKAKLRDEIEKTQNYAGITGTFSMSATDHNGLGKASFVMIKIVDGKWTIEK